jgi:hypothetical protein
MTIKRGNWLGCSDDLTRKFELPFIDHAGKTSGCTLYTKEMTQQDYIATLIATTSKRISSWAYSHSKIERTSSSFLKTLCARVSTIYVLTKNSYLLDRVLVLMKDFQKYKNTIAGLIAKHASKLDENKGFIYSQACSHAHWLTSRAVRPRDKSRPALHTFPFSKVGVTDFEKRKIWIFHALYTVCSHIMYIGKSYYSLLRPSNNYV